MHLQIFLDQTTISLPVQATGQVETEAIRSGMHSSATLQFLLTTYSGFVDLPIPNPKFP